MSGTDHAHERYTTNVDKGRYPQDVQVPLPAPFANAAGEIQNLLLKPVQSVARIESVKGAVRANHWHRTDFHYAFVESGKVLYFERDVGCTTIPEPITFGPGEMFFTPPAREHAMLFAKDSVIFTFARRVRNHEEHEADVVRVAFITPEIAAEWVR